MSTIVSRDTWIKKITTHEWSHIARHLVERHPTVEGESLARRPAGSRFSPSARPILTLKLYLSFVQPSGIVEGEVGLKGLESDVEVRKEHRDHTVLAALPDRLVQH